MFNDILYYMLIDIALPCDVFPDDETAPTDAEDRDEDTDDVWIDVMEEGSLMTLWCGASDCKDLKWAFLCWFPWLY